MSYRLIILGTAALTCIAGVAAAKGSNHVRTGYLTKGASWLDPATAEASGRPLFDLLARKAGITYSLARIADSAELVSKMKARAFDMVAAWSVDYARVSSHVKLKPLAIVRMAGRTRLRLLLLTRRGDKVTSLKQLKGKRLSLYKDDPNNAIYLRVLLARAGISSPAAFFSKTKVTNSHQTSVLDVFFGNADACLVVESMYDAMAQLNPQLKTKLSVLHTSARLANPLLFVPAEMPADLFQRLRRAALAADKSKEGKQLLLMAKFEALLPVQAADLDSTLALWRAYQALQPPQRPGKTPSRRKGRPGKRSRPR